MSDLVKRIAGTYLSEGQKPPVLAWLQEQLRIGDLRPMLEAFLRRQPEAFDGSRVQVEEVTSTVIRCRIPHFIVDHESPRPLRSDMEFELNPVTGTALRQDRSGC